MFGGSAWRLIKKVYSITVGCSPTLYCCWPQVTTLGEPVQISCSGFVSTAYYVQQYIVTTMFDDRCNTVHSLFVFLLFFWCPCMAINVVSVQYNGGLFPDSTVDSMLLPHRGTRLNVMKRFCICSLWSHLPKRFDRFSPWLGDAQKV